MTSDGRHLLFNILCGVLQGCPLSATLFVMCINPFLEHMDQSVVARNLGVIRACADDIGAALKSFQYLRKLALVFEWAKNIANLTLKPAKCKLIPSSLPFSPELAKFLAEWIQSNIPAWANFNVVPHAVYLGFVMGPRIKDVQWTTAISKWLSRGKAICSSHACPAIATFAYNHTSVPVLTYRGQLLIPPHDIQTKELHLLHFLWHMPTNTFELSTFFNVGSIGAHCIKSVSCMCKAAMFRTASRTITGWEHQTRLLKDLVLEYLPGASWSSNILAPDFWDTPAYASNLAKSFWEDGVTPVTVRTQRIPPAPRQLPIQSLAYKAFVGKLFPDNIFELVHRRLLTLGVVDIGSTAFNIVVWCRAAEFHKTVDSYCSVCWLKTICNGWATTYRMHEPTKLDCVFGCADARDQLQHYLLCPNMWSIVDDVFQATLPPSLLERINVRSPSKRGLAIITAIFNMYHTVKIGHRCLVESAMTSRRFAAIHSLCREVALMYRNRYFPERPAQPHTLDVDLDFHLTEDGSSSSSRRFVNALPVSSVDAQG